ncbi:DUF3631 domain-containing protein, partial [Desulfobacterota bacterium AH_259_B03_O07]|nr:DUF3631 domain-containing protein [Desulfobacterota bacterium AH_259_B03_O07]
NQNDIPVDAKPMMHPGMDVINGNLIYGIPNGKKPLFITNRKLISLGEIERTKSVGVYPQQLKFSKIGIQEYLEGKTVDPVKLFNTIKNLLTNHIIFQRDLQGDLTAVWVMGTYLYRVFPLYAYYWVKSPIKRCGKTKLLEIIALLSFNSNGIETSPSEAPLFRVPAITGGTLCWDEAEGLYKNKDKGDLISILNTAYRHDGVVGRCEGKEHKVRFHDVFRPIALSGISSLPDTVSDRSLKIELARKKRGEKVERLAYRSQDKYQQIRDDLHMFALSNASTIMQAYSQFDDSLIPSECDDRLRDAFETLMSIIAPIMSLDKTHRVLSQLQTAARALSGIRNLDEGDIPFTRAIEILRIELDSKAELILNAKEALSVFNDNGLDWMEKPKHASDMLNKLGYYSGTHRQGHGVKRGYLIKKEHLNDLFLRYASNI